MNNFYLSLIAFHFQLIRRQNTYISYSAKAYAIKRTRSATYSLSRYASLSWRPGHRIIVRMVILPLQFKDERLRQFFSINDNIMRGISRVGGGSP
jgi:hypothetical protein